ncbi:MAG: enolase C-terminal domain-like protein [Solirubrobacterales bacterium]
MTAGLPQEDWPAIASVEVIPCALPFRKPYVTARGRLERRETVLLRVRDSDGIEGLGEAVPLSLRGGDSLATVAEQLRGWGKGGGAASLSAPARCAVETAMLDLRARAQEVPAWRLLGAGECVPVICNATLTAGEPAAVATQAKAWAAEGFGTFKLKVGVDGDDEQVQAVRAAVGEKARIRVDANGAWTRQAAAEELGAMDRHGLELAEEPVHGLEELAALRRTVGVPVAADESLSDPAAAAEAARTGACDLCTVKLSKVGGIEAMLEIAALLPTYLSSALDGPVGIAAAAHAAQALRSRGDAGVAHGLATQRLFAGTVAAVECEIRAGRLRPPDGPGLGVVLDEDALERHRL